MNHKPWCDAGPDKGFMPCTCERRVDDDRRGKYQFKPGERVLWDLIGEHIDRRKTTRRRGEHENLA